MRTTTNTKSKRPTKPRSPVARTQSSFDDRSEGAETYSSSANSNSMASTTTALTTMVDTVLATTGAGQELTTTVSNFVRAIDGLTAGDAQDTVAQVQNVIEHATQTYEHGKETLILAKEAMGSVRGTAKNVFAHVKENPQPFIAAAVPAVVGLFMLYRRSQAGTSSAPQPRRANTSRPLGAR